MFQNQTIKKFQQNMSSSLNHWISIVFLFQLISIGFAVIYCENGRTLPDSALPIFDTFLNSYERTFVNKMVSSFD